MKLRAFKLIGVLSLLTLTGWAQESEITTGLVKLRYNNVYVSDYYLCKSSQETADFEVNRNGNPDDFYIDKVGESYLIISGKPEISGDYVRGIYAFANAQNDPAFELTHDGFDESNGYFDSDVYKKFVLASVQAVRKGNTLYVLKNEQVTDYSQLEELVQSGKVKKIDLTKISNFEYQFIPYDGSSYYIESEIGATVGVDDSSGRIKMVGKTAISARTSSFFIESQGGGVTGVTLNAYQATLVAGETFRLTANILPADAVNKAVTWSSSNNSVATVSATGLVTAVSAGTATINATTTDGGYTATCTVTVELAMRNETIDSEINIWVYGENLYVRTPSATTFSIYTLTGAQVKRLSVGAGVTAIDLNHLPKGVYIVKGEGWTKKIINN
jgi:uncharacterized protein YjdB